MKKAIGILILVFLFIAGCSQGVEEETVILDERCSSWTFGRCTGLQRGYYFLGNDCKYFEGTACTPPPFESEEECIAVCENP